MKWLHCFKPVFLLVMACFGMSTCFMIPAQAQSAPQGINIDSLKILRFSTARLKTFEGFYQSPQNKEMVVQFQVVSDSLMAKLLWADIGITILPISDTSFVSLNTVGEKKRHIPFYFIRDREGLFTQASILEMGIWTLAKDYKPFVKKEIEHTPAQLKIFEGLYEIEDGRGLLILVTEKDNELSLRQYWNGNETIVVPDSAMSFFDKEHPIIAIQFIRDRSGNIAQMAIAGQPKWNRIRPVHFTSQELKAFEGKYQFKEDKDNLIRITAKDSGLVVRQLWDGKEIILEPGSKSFFYCLASSYSLNFTRAKDGSITQVMVLNKDLFEKIGE